MKEFIQEKKKTIIIISIFIILAIILKIILGSVKTNNTLINSYIKTLTSKDISEKLKENLSCNLEEVLKKNRVPYLKLSNSTYNKINDELIQTFLLRACYQNGYIDYEASYNDDILSIALNISYETTDDLAYLEYKTYNINTKNHTQLTNQDILNKYQLSVNQVNTIVKNYMIKYYNYERENDLLDLDISFNEYLNDLNFKDITLSNMNLYIDNKKDLYIFKDYDLSYGMSIDEKYPYLTIKFKLKSS